jgi:hypothetical protein
MYFFGYVACQMVTTFTYHFCISFIHSQVGLLVFFFFGESCTRPESINLLASITLCRKCIFGKKDNMG